MRETARYLSRALDVLTMFPLEGRAEVRIRLLLQRAWAWRAGGEFLAALDDLKAMVSSAAEAGNLGEEVSALVNLSRFQLYVDRRLCLDVASQAVELSGASKARRSGRWRRAILPICVLYQRLCWLTHRGIPESRRC